MIKQALGSYATSKAFQKVFAMDRTRTVGASEIGLCARRMYYVKTEGREDEDYTDRWGAKVRGTIMEEKFWQPAMTKRFGKNLLFSGKKQTTFADKFLSATPDGLVINQKRDALKALGVEDIGASKCFVIECKSIDPRVNLQKAKEEHTFQAQAQMGLIREFTIHKPDYAVISYMDASFWDEVMEFTVKFDPKIYAVAHARAVKIKTASGPQDLQPEGWISGGKDCEYCPHTKSCGIIRRSVPETEAAADPQFVAEVTDMCKDHNTLAAKIEADQCRLNGIKQSIKDRLREKSVRKIPGVVSWSPVKGATRLDQKSITEAAIAAGIDIDLHKKTGEPTDTLRVLVGVDEEVRG